MFQDGEGIESDKHHFESHLSITNRPLLKNELDTLAILRFAYLKIEEDTDLKQNLHKKIIIIYPFLKQLFATKMICSYLNESTSNFSIK